MEKINLGIGYTIDKNDGSILGLTETNYKKDTISRYKEITCFLLIEFCKSNQIDLSDIEFI